MNEFKVVLKKLIKAEAEISRLNGVIKKLTNKPIPKDNNVDFSGILNKSNIKNKDRIRMILEVNENITTSDLCKMTGIQKRSVQRYRKSLNKVYKSPVKEQSLINKYSKTYLIKNKRNGLYKIGRSKDPESREKTLQSEEPNIIIVKVWDKNIESELHKMYAKQRLRGEWFELSKIQVRYICTNY
jgi:hypothetical protein